MDLMSQGRKRQFQPFILSAVFSLLDWVHFREEVEIFQKHFQNSFFFSMKYADINIYLLVYYGTNQNKFWIVF